MSDTASTRSLPLAGKRVLVTRPRHQAGALSNLLRQAGAHPVEFPVIEIVPTLSEDLDDALREIDGYDWIVFTSVNTVRIVAERRQDLGPAKIAAIGDATAAALEERGMNVDLVPDTFVAEAVLAGLIAAGVVGKSILLPRADIARDTLPDGLREAGATVNIVAAYSTRPPEDVNLDIVNAIERGEIDIVTVTSPSTVRNLLALTGGALPEVTQIACIGPITAQAVRDAGLRVDAMAEEYTIQGLVNALVQMGDDHESV